MTAARSAAARRRRGKASPGARGDAATGQGPNPAAARADSVAEEPLLRAIGRLREAIVSGRFMPSERLIEADLAGSLGTSRANVRTALAVLEAEGLVSREPNRGARVRRIPEGEAVEIAEARIALEALAARKAAHAATRADGEALVAVVERMGRALAAGDLATLAALNGEFHGRIRQLAASQTLSRLIVNLRHKVVRVQYQTMFMPGRAAVSLREHGDIARAIAANDAAGAEAAMRGHLASVLADLERSFTAARAMRP